MRVGVGRSVGVKVGCGARVVVGAGTGVASGADSTVSTDASLQAARRLAMNIKIRNRRIELAVVSRASRECSAIAHTF